MMNPVDFPKLMRTDSVFPPGPGYNCVAVPGKECLHPPVANESDEIEYAAGENANKSSCSSGATIPENSSLNGSLNETISFLV